MSIARKCDRCEGFYNDYYTDNQDIFTAITTFREDLSGNRYGYKHYDLCPDCKRDFEDWLCRIGEVV